MELITGKIFPAILDPLPSIRAIIFDFGGVLLNIDPRRTRQAFINLGLQRFETGASVLRTSGIYEQLETGTITPDGFRAKLRSFFDRPVTDGDLDQAWNAMLLDLPEPRIRLLEALRNRYRIFLLSNSNQIHFECYERRFRDEYGYDGFDALFEKAWFSFRLGLKKPGTEIFRRVIDDAGLDPSSTLFIDDTLMHVEGARKAGLHAYHLDLEMGGEITHLFQP